MSLPLTPVTLDGSVVRLEPLSLDHLDALAEVGLDPDLWALTVARVTNRDDLKRWIESALVEARAGRALPFVTVERASGRIAGSTRFGNYAPFDGRVEIGWTWVAREWQRSGVNTDAKLQLLTHAFETLGCGRVELKTDVLNHRSRNAMLRLGAREEGILRKHARTEGGRVRDTIYFSVVDDEWPEVKRRLQSLLASH
ncbi:MAG: GNAT family protein, partial [Gemmatimonadales bacterium]